MKSRYILIRETQGVLTQTQRGEDEAKMEPREMQAQAKQGMMVATRK